MTKTASHARKSMNQNPSSLLSKVAGWFGASSSDSPGTKQHIPPYSAGAVAYYYAPGKAVWKSRRYQSFADEGYVKNVVAHRCIELVASNAASYPYQLVRWVKGQAVEVHNHPVLELLKRPNPCMAGIELLSSLYTHKLISGNAYVQMVRNGSGAPAELYALRPDRMTVVAGKGCLPQGYIYSVGDRDRKFPVEAISGKSDILHLKSLHPLNDWYGLSAFEAAAYAIDQHNQAGQWNQALLQNGARPSGALVVKGEGGTAGGYLSDDQYMRLKSQLDEQYSGAMNAGRPVLLEGGLEWREMSLSPKDMDFLNIKHSSARDIALAFGVPPQMLGIPGDSTYSNYAEARNAFWEETIDPLVNQMLSALNNWLLPEFGGRKGGLELRVVTNGG